MTRESRRHPEGARLRRFFAGVTEYAFGARLGVVDPPLVDYLSTLLVRFVRSDEIYSVRSPTGRRLDQVSDMLQEAQFRQGEARRQIHRHIGDYTLFWLGVYPEVVERMRTGRKDALIDYHQQGKRAYYIASTIPVEQESAPTDVLQRLSDQFDLCVYGLSEVRRQWEQTDNPPGPAVLID
jgi:hypothetical protein